MNNLAQRTITGIIIVLVIITAICLSFYSFICLVWAINLLSLLEFYRLFDSLTISPARPASLVLSLSILVTFIIVLLNVTDWKILLVNIPITFSVFIVELYRQAENPIHNLAFTFLSIICITIPLCFLMSIAFLPDRSGIYHYPLILGYFLILWAADTGAYFIGSTLGKNPLFKRVSPGKTWEGSVGGTLCALFAAYLISRYITRIHTFEWMSLAILVVVIGTFGDLVKSMMKRSLHIKDSGTILPGHGGMLDRFDSLLSSAPFVFGYLTLFGHG